MDVVTLVPATRGPFGRIGHSVRLFVLNSNLRSAPYSVFGDSWGAQSGTTVVGIVVREECTLQNLSLVKNGRRSWMRTSSHARLILEV